MKNKKRILIIEDDEAIREGIRFMLLAEGFFVEEAANGLEGLEKTHDETDLVVLDLMMPGMSGIDVCKEIRKKSFVPILILTAKITENDKLIGFKAGADDYLTKPFSHAELMARIHALLRRRHEYDLISASKSTEHWIQVHGIRINTENNQVLVNGNLIHLTNREYDILLLFMEYPKKIFTLQNIYESIWKEPFLSASANTVMVHIRNIRSKIETDPQHPEILLTVWGRGYKIA